MQLGRRGYNLISAYHLVDRSKNACMRRRRRSFSTWRRTPTVKRRKCLWTLCISLSWIRRWIRLISRSNFRKQIGISPTKSSRLRVGFRCYVILMWLAKEWEGGHWPRCKSHGWGRLTGWALCSNPQTLIWLQGSLAVKVWCKSISLLNSFQNAAQTLLVTVILASPYSQYFRANYPPCQLFLRTKTKLRVGQPGTRRRDHFGFWIPLQKNRNLSNLFASFLSASFCSRLLYTWLIFQSEQKVSPHASIKGST